MSSPLRSLSLIPKTPTDKPVEEKTKLPTYTVDFTSRKFAFYGSISDLDCYRLIATEANGKSKTPVICRMYHLTRLGRDELYKKDVEIAQQVGHHPHLLRFMGIATDEEWGSIIVYENGGSAGNLDEMLAKTASHPESQIPFSSRIRWAGEAISAISHIHRFKLVHGDLTPWNILFDTASDNQVHLKIANMHSGHYDTKHLHLHLYSPDTSSVRPKTRWLPPEDIYQKSEIDDDYHKRREVWQLGILIAELMLFTLPYAACTYTRNVVSALANEPPFTQQELQNAVGPKFANFILQCCELNPKKRPTIEKINEELWPEVLPELNTLSQAVAVQLCDTAVEQQKAKLELKV